MTGGDAPRPPTGRWRFSIEHAVMAGSVLALVVLVVLPLGFLVWGSATADGRPTLAHFREALSSRLYVQALQNSLILGAWAAVLSVAIGLPLAWAVSRTNAPAKRFFHLTAVVSYVTPPFLTAIAFVNLFGPNAGLVNRFVRDVLGVAGPDLQRVLHGGPGARHRAPHVPVRVSAGLERARIRRRLDGRVGPDPGRGALAHGDGGDRAAGGAGRPLRGADRVRERHRPLRLAGDHRPARPRLHPAHAHLRAVRLSAAVRAGLRDVAGLRGHHGGGALRAAPVSGPALLRDLGRQGQPPAARRPRPGPLGAARLRRAGLRGGGARALSHLARGVGEPLVGTPVLAEPHAPALSLRALRIRRHPPGHLEQPGPGQRHGDLDRAPGQPRGLDRSPDDAAGAENPRPRLADPAGASRDRGGRGPHPVLATGAVADLRDVPDHPARLHRTLRATGRALGQRRLPPDRPVAGGGGAGHRRRLVAHVHPGHRAPGPSRAVRRLAPRLRPGAAGTERVDLALQLGVHHPRRGRLQPLRDRLARASGGPLGQIKLLPVDYDEIEKESRALKTRFAEIFQ